MVGQAERLRRSEEAPIVAGLPNVPGIGAALQLTPGLGLHLRGLADELLVHDFPGATISRGERELLAMAVSAGNDCYFCMDSHGAHAAAVFELAGMDKPRELVDQVKQGDHSRLDDKMRALIDIARIVRGEPAELTAADVQRACAAGASDADVQLAVLIAAAFCMYNRLVEGFRARTPASIEAYSERARQIAESGYSMPPGGAGR
jgi:uncharacterized peroxidase-related enzyme